MIGLEITEEQAGALEALLQRELSDLKVEIHRTDNWQFREALQARQTALAGCLERLQQARTTAAASHA